MLMSSAAVIDLDNYFRQMGSGQIDCIASENKTAGYLRLGFGAFICLSILRFYEISINNESP